MFQNFSKLKNFQTNVTSKLFHNFYQNHSRSLDIKNSSELETFLIKKDLQDSIFLFNKNSLKENSIN